MNVLIIDDDLGIQGTALETIGHERKVIRPEHIKEVLKGKGTMSQLWLASHSSTPKAGH